MASSSTSGQIPKRWTYDVFLSFCGKDVRKNFLSHLYKSFTQAGIYTFKDDKELKSGDNISPSLVKAIENSRVHLVVLSENYASSSWCLDELRHIMECRRKNDRHVVIPLFYNVDPSDVRKQRGSFHLSFHERCYRRKVMKWMKALTDVGNLAGFVNTDYRTETDLIEEITRVISERISVSYMQLPAYAVGIRRRVHHINNLMCFGSDAVKTIGICGMSGVGKTTIAKAAYNEISHRFEGTCFVENFGEYFNNLEGKLQLQRKLLSDILRRNCMEFNNLDYEVKERFRNKRVLVVFDDVKDKKQLNSAAIDLSCFGSGSRIIITSKNQHFLEQLRIEDIYSLDVLTNHESLELVSRHAFRTDEPPKEFLKLSEKLVEYCGNLPLALEVLGTFLYNRSISKWESTLELLKQTPDDDIQAKLQISFNELSVLQKDIFLDISCFFIGMDKDYVSGILDGCKFCPEIGLTVLKERCLITVRDNSLMMHDLLREMGRQIIRGPFQNNCERWSRMWNPVDAIDVLESYIGTDATEGLSLKAEVRATERINLEANAFSNLRNLRLLQISHVVINGSYENFPKRLRWLWWLGFPNDSFPKKLCLRSLVVMDLQYSKLERFWDDQKQPLVLKELKYLDLSHSDQLIETPNFNHLPKLEKLLLINCQNLGRVHNSIGILHEKLVLLNLSGCTKLAELPLEFYMLKSLETLILSGCSGLERLDDGFGRLESLTTFQADYSSLMQFPSLSDKLEKLEELSLNGCQGAPSILPSLNSLTGLKTLRLGFCNLYDELVPEDLGSLPCLEELDIQGNKFCNLRTDFARLSSLQILRLDSCSELQSVSSLPKTLRSLYARNCIVLERTPDLSECLKLLSLNLTNCFNLVETPGLDKLKTVGLIHMEMCNRIPYSYREKIMQGCIVSANGGIFIPGTSLPSWVSFENDTNSISFTVPESSNRDLVGFTLWTPYVSEQDDVVSAYTPKIKMKNQTKGEVWSHNLATDQIRTYHQEHIWQGHFSNDSFLLKAGDQVEVFVDFGDQVTILETGLTLSYVDKKERPTLSYREEDIALSDTYNSETERGETSYEQMAHTEEVYVDSIYQLTNRATRLTLAYREEDADISDTEYDKIPEEQLIRTEEVDDHLVTEESQSRPPRKMREGLKKTLLMAFCLLLFSMFVLKYGEPFGLPLQQ